MFKQAKPIWIQGLQEEMHITCGLYTQVERPVEQAVLRVATSGFYRVFVNDEFVFYGPVRCAHGHYRVDEIPLQLTAAVNHIAVEVVNYFSASYAALKQPGFIQLELEAENTVWAATAAPLAGFALFRLGQRIRRIQRYSYQRPFAESYRLQVDTNAWRLGQPSPDAVPAEAEETAPKTLLPRELPLHTFPAVRPDRVITRGTFTVQEVTELLRDRSLTDVGATLNGYPMEDLEIHLSDEIQRYSYTPADGEAPYTGTVELAAGEYEILSLPTERTGFSGMDIDAHAPSVLYLMVDEILLDGDVDPLRMECVNAIRLELEPGEHRFMNMEPLGFKYVKLVCLTGGVTVSDWHLVEVVTPYELQASLPDAQPAEQRIFDAAWQSLRQNTADQFMDCPTRERAGWLCDSFFIGRAAQFFTGSTLLEKQFLENFILPDRFDDIPEGMLPGCYPADSVVGNFIPNWVMWYVVQLYDYTLRTGDAGLAVRSVELVDNLMNVLKRLENADGLLERLPGWVFVEWSRANDLVQDINFPTNMLYAYILRVAGELYNRPELTQRSEALKEVIRRRSFNGEFFVDNEVYQDGVPVSTGETTEVCQYYAFFFGIATPQTYPALWKTLTTDFGPRRQEMGAYPAVHPANAFIGNYLRLELLLRHGMYDLCRQEAVGYFEEMANRTGTLWENMTPMASCNHGFAAYVAYLLYYAIRREQPPCDLVL